MLKSNFETTKQRIDGDLPKNNVDLAHAYDWFFKVVVGQDISAHEVGINWKMQKKTTTSSSDWQQSENITTLKKFKSRGGGSSMKTISLTYLFD